MNKIDIVIKILDDSKAKDILNLAVDQFTSIADNMVICTATSNRHAKAISDKLLRQLKTCGYKSIGVTGLEDCQWILLDCNEVIVHIMLQESRDFYQLENLWQQK